MPSPQDALTPHPISDTIQRLSEENREDIERVRMSKPSAFTVGGVLKDGALVGGITYDRKWSNGWGATAYARAWWHDWRVVPHDVVVGGEVRKEFK